MSKYKVGDRFNISGKIVDVGDGVYRIQAGAFDILCYDSAIVSDPMTAEEAWDIAKKLFADYSNVELDEIFGKGWSQPKLMDLTPQEAKASLTSDQYKLYNLIWKRFIASLMSNCVQDTVKVEIEAKKDGADRFCTFSASGFSVK